MRSRDIESFIGIVAGVVGVVGAAYLLNRFLKNKKPKRVEEYFPEVILEDPPLHLEPIIQKAPRIAVARVKNNVTAKKVSKLAVVKLGNAKKLLTFMKKGKEYTQIMLEESSKIPYRSVRRYIETLTKQGKIIATGYGKGKKFVKK